MFNTMYARPETIPVETGSEFDKTYTIRIDEYGHKRLLCTGETNRYEKVQQFLEECKIENILAAATLDPNALNKRVGQYIDTINMPKNLMEAQNKILQITEEFNSLPVEIRHKFDDSVEKYVGTYGEESWAKALGLWKEKETEKVTPEEGAAENE